MIRMKQQISSLFSQLQQQYNAQQLVPAWGNQHAEIMFIGDAPGKDELTQGPFIGNSGKFFDQLLQSIGLRRENIYLTNVVKFRAEKGDPKKKDIAAFYPLLQAEIEQLKPKIVVVFGRVALSVFLPDLKVSEIHGQIYHIQQREHAFILLPMYHPAAAMHNGKMRPILRQDFRILGDVWNALD